MLKAMLKQIQKPLKKVKKNNLKFFFMGGTNTLGGGQKSIDFIWGIGAGEVIAEKTPHNAFDSSKFFY